MRLLHYSYRFDIKKTKLSVYFYYIYYIKNILYIDIYYILIYIIYRKNYLSFLAIWSNKITYILSSFVFISLRIWSASLLRISSLVT